LPEQQAGRIVEAMRAHHVRERRLDQRIAVNERAVEVEDEPPRMPMRAG